MTAELSADKGAGLKFAATCAELRLIWESFERQSDDLHLVGSREFQERVEVLVASLGAISDGMERRAEEQNQTRQLHATAGSGHAASNLLHMFGAAALRQEFLTLLAPKGVEAQQLLEEIGNG